MSIKISEMSDKVLSKQMRKAQREIARRKRAIGMLSQQVAEHRRQFEGVCGRWDRLNEEAKRRFQ